MRVLGISPLDKDATVSLVEDGRVIYAAAEERFSRKKQHAGFPERALERLFGDTGVTPSEVDVVAYAFLTWDREASLMRGQLAATRREPLPYASYSLRDLLRAAGARVPDRSSSVQGLSDPNQRNEKPPVKKLLYSLLGGDSFVARHTSRSIEQRWIETAEEEHRHWQSELERGLGRFGMLPKLRRFEHHLAHAANAYYASGFERALIITLDGYGSGLCGSVSLGEGGDIKRLHGIPYPSSPGTFYENVTSGLGFKPDRHAGKIVGLAAYGDPAVLGDVLRSRIRQGEGTFRIDQNFNYYFTRLLADRFPMVDVAAAYQEVLEELAAGLVRHWAAETGCRAVVLSGGVAANVKMNQRIHEAEGVERVFVYPNMGDGGCGTGLGLYLTRSGRPPEPISHVYLGPSFSDTEMRDALDAAGLDYEEPADVAAEVARRLHEGEVIARFDGRMEYGPRALGNRSILYHARDPDVNEWLNRRLGRTEFMPFAPVCLYEARERLFLRTEGAELSAQFMTITFDCSAEMRERCPAAVHIDGTARPQLVKRETNPVYYAIIEHFEKLGNVPCVINTSFNMHEEPIVCTPDEAVRAFLASDLDALSIGPYLASSDRLTRRER